MSETLIGVLVGGLLSGLGTWITLAIQQRRWRTELKISQLKEKRARLEAVCERTLKELPHAMQENSYPSDMMSDFDFLLPTEVSDIFNEMMKKPDKTELDYKHYYYKISRQMKKALKSIDDAIEKVANG